MTSDQAFTLTASSSDLWPAKIQVTAAAVDAQCGDGYSRRRLLKAAEAKRRLSQGWRPQVTREKLARAEELPPQIDLSACRRWHQLNSGLLAECGEYLSLAQMDVLRRFAIAWAHQQNGSYALNRYATRIQASSMGYRRNVTNFKALCDHLGPERADAMGRALNADGRAWLLTDWQINSERRQHQRLNYRAPSNPINRDREGDRETLGMALREFADKLFCTLEKYPNEKLLPEYNESAV